jgi:hypothetical protein
VPERARLALLLVRRRPRLRATARRKTEHLKHRLDSLPLPTAARRRGRLALPQIPLPASTA